MKAWIVADASYDWQQVVFAPTKHEAYYKSDGYQNGAEYIEMRATRKKEWDQYAEQGYVPKEVMMLDGWWFECYGVKQNPRRRCCAYVDQDMDGHKVVDNHVYCAECAQGLELPQAIETTEQSQAV